MDEKHSELKIRVRERRLFVTLFFFLVVFGDNDRTVRVSGYCFDKKGKKTM